MYYSFSFIFATQNDFNLSIKEYPSIDIKTFHIFLYFAWQDLWLEWEVCKCIELIRGYVRKCIWSTRGVSKHRVTDYEKSHARRSRNFGIFCTWKNEKNDSNVFNIVKIHALTARHTVPSKRLKYGQSEENIGFFMYWILLRSLGMAKIFSHFQGYTCCCAR